MVTSSTSPPSEPPKHLTQTSSHARTEAQQQENSTTTKHKKSYRFLLAFAGICVTVFIVTLDATILSVGLPIIAKDLDASSLDAFWASIAFLLVAVVTQPIYASLSTIFGRLAPLNIALVFFAIGSIILASASRPAMFISGRAVQGLGGGGLDILGEIIIADITTLKERPLYLGIAALPMALGTVSGPIIGAALSEKASWRWIGWINLPLLATAFLLCFFFLRIPTPKNTMREKVRRVDWAGMILFACGLTCSSLAITWGGSMYPWRSWRTLSPLLLGIDLLVFFCLCERTAEQPMFPYRMFLNRTAVATLLSAMVHGLVVYSILFYLPIYFEGVRERSPLQAAVLALPMSVTAILFSVFSTLIIERCRRYCLVIWSGWAVLVVGLALMSLLNSGTSRALSSGVQVLVGTGVGTLFCVLAIPMQACVEIDFQGIAVGIMVSLRLFGAVAGISVGSSIFNNVFARQIRSIGTLPPQASVLANTNDAIAFIATLPHLSLEPAVLASILHAYRKALQDVWIALTAFAAFGFVSSLFTKELTLEKEDLSQQAFIERRRVQNEDREVLVLTL